MFFSQQSEDNKPADLSCGYKQPCQPTANKLKTFASRQSVRRIVVWSGDEGRSVSVAAVFVYLHGVVGLEFVWNLSAVRGLTQDSAPKRCQITLTDKCVDFTLPASLCEYFVFLEACLLPVFFFFKGGNIKSKFSEVRTRPSGHLLKYNLPSKPLPNCSGALLTFLARFS